MNLLLDTHAFLWFVEGNAKLSVRARESIEDAANAKWVSVASLWEMAIKISLGRLRISQPFDRFIREQMDRNGFTLLVLRVEHFAEVATLPFHHRDPFDRLLAAQCISDGFVLVSGDAALDHYPVARLW